jgi:hypothetical protein
MHSLEQPYELVKPPPAAAPPDAAGDALAFLRLLWPEAPTGFLLLWLKADKKRSLWFPATDLESFAAAAAAAAAKGADAYLGCALSPRDCGPHNRCEAQDALGIADLWADLDFAHPAHQKPALVLPPDLDSALSLVREMPLPPSLLVYSGHGLQPRWLLTRPWLFAGPDDRAAAAALVAAWQAQLRRLAAGHGWTLDSTQDLARVLRLPGTINWRADPVAVTCDLPAEVRRYDPADLRAALDAAAPPPSPAAVFRQECPDASPPPALNSRTLPDDELLRHAAAAQNGAKFLRLWAGDTAGHNGDDSRADAALVEILAFYAGPDPDRIDRLFRQSGLMRDKWDERRRDSTYGRDTIAKILGKMTEFYAMTEPADDDGPTAAPSANGQDNRGPGLDWFRKRGVPVAGVRKLGRVRGHYELVLKDGRAVELGTAGDVLTPRRVQAAIADATAVAVPLLTLAKWRPIGQAILAAAKAEDIDCEPDDELRDWLESFLNGTTRYEQGCRTMKDEAGQRLYLTAAGQRGREFPLLEVILTLSYIRSRCLKGEDAGRFDPRAIRGDDGHVYLTLPALQHHLRFHLDIRITRPELTRRLRQAGWKPAQLTARDEDGKLLKTRAWGSPPGWDDGWN